MDDNEKEACESKSFMSTLLAFVLIIILFERLIDAGGVCTRASFLNSLLMDSLGECGELGVGMPDMACECIKSSYCRLNALTGLGLLSMP